MSQDLTLMLEAHKYWHKIAKALNCDIIGFTGKTTAILRKGMISIEVPTWLGDSIIELQKRNKKHGH